VAAGVVVMVVAGDAAAIAEIAATAGTAGNLSELSGVRRTRRWILRQKSYAVVVCFETLRSTVPCV
jgi:hypothetical protein